jgi:HEAT repeat protein
MSIDDLVRQLEDPDADTRALALGSLIRHGSAALPALYGALKSAKVETRQYAAEGVASIADPSSADVLHAALSDNDGYVRSQAAVGLMRMGDPRALAALVATIADYENVLRGDETLSSAALNAYGSQALPALAPVLKDVDPWRRRYAFAVVRKLASNLLGPQGDWQQLHSTLGTYDPDGPADERDAAADQWQAWIRTHLP